MCEKKRNPGSDRAQTVREFFLEAPACLTHSLLFSPQGLRVCSGIIRISSMMGIWLRMKRIPVHRTRLSGIWHIFSVWLSLCSCHMLWSRPACAALRALFVVFGWVSVLCTLAHTLVRNRLRSHIIAAVGVASVVCVVDDPWQLDDTHRGTWHTHIRTCHQPSTTSLLKRTNRYGGLGSYCGLGRGAFLSLGLRVDKHDMQWHAEGEKNLKLLFLSALGQVTLGKGIYDLSGFLSF